MAEQMDHYLEIVNPVEGERVVLDHEDEGVSLGQLKDAVEYLLQQRPDLQVTIYSGHLIKEQLGSNTDKFLTENTSLWIAQYTGAEEPTWPYRVWPAWSLWQYTDKATAVGITGNVDGNRWNGSDENLIRWFGPAGQEPEPEPEPASASIDMALRVEGDVTVSVTLNDELVFSGAFAKGRKP